MKITEIKIKGLVILLFAAAFSSEAADIRTVDGRIYNDVQFDRVGKKGLIFRHRCGIVTLSPEMLTPADRGRYSSQITEYDSLKAGGDGKPQPRKNRSAQAGKEIDAAVKMYTELNPEAFGRLEEAIRKYAGTPEAENGRKILAEWKKKKQTQLIVHHPGCQTKCICYVFRYSAEMESTLNKIAANHWEVNDMNDAYSGAKAQAQMNIRMGGPDRADQELKRAQVILRRSQEARTKNNRMFEELLLRDYVVDKTDFSHPGMWLSGVTGEFLFFIVEVVENGKYVRAWCCRAKGGADLFITGRKIECNYGEESPRRGAEAASGPKKPAEHFDLDWMLKNKGYLHKTEKELKSEKFRHVAQFDSYKKEPFPPGVSMDCFLENGQVKRSILKLGSYSDPGDAAKRYADYAATLEAQSKGRNGEWKTFTTKSPTNTKEIKICDLKDHDFMVTLYRMELPIIRKHILFIAAFSKKHYPDFDSVVKELDH